MTPLPIFLGYDPRESVGYHTCVQSIIEHASIPVAIIPLRGERRDGTNDFIYARFLVPHLCRYNGVALFADGSDMLFREDVAKLLDLRDERAAVQVVQRQYRTRHPRKYVGSAMEADNRDYDRKNWSSLMLFNCYHFSNRVLTPEYVAAHDGKHLHSFAWLHESGLGSLPTRWNLLVGEEGEDEETPALVHFTLGIPAMTHYRTCRWSNEWWAVYDRSRRAG